MPFQRNTLLPSSWLKLKSVRKWMAYIELRGKLGQATGQKAMKSWDL
jgi:hypothetical protein